MNLIEKRKNVLHKAKILLQDIETELHFRSPYSSKLSEIRDMLEWLNDNKPKRGRDLLNGDLWADPTECLLAQPAPMVQIMLNLVNHHGSELIYEPLICEAGKPFYFILLKSKCQGAFDAFVILFCHYLRYMEIMDWNGIRPDHVNDLINDKLLVTLAMSRVSIVSDRRVLNEMRWQTSVALDDILKYPEAPDVGIIQDGIKLNVDADYTPPIHSVIRNAIQLEQDNDNVLFFFETEIEYVFFGS